MVPMPMSLYHYVIILYEIQLKLDWLRYDDKR